MSVKPLVSIVVIFLNAEKYLAEAVESIFAQTYDQWELLLVDDGSTDSSTDLARQYAAQQPDKTHYLAHSGRANRGMSASRNLGIGQAKGRYIALLDADDVWLPHKLQEQVALMETNSEAGMLYGQSLYWYSWTQNPEDKKLDFMPVSNIPAGTLMPPPGLLPLFLRGKTVVPCPSNIMVRRSVMAEVGGFVESFTGSHEDQAFYSKICLQTPILVCNDCWNYYRQHPEANTAVSQKTGQNTAARQFFLNWLQGYLHRRKITDTSVWQALRQETWLLEAPLWLPQQIRPYLRWTKKWLVKIEGAILPDAVSDWLWLRN